MYFIYILNCDDGSLYTGITTDPERRLSEHLKERRGGAKYTQAHRPLSFAALWTAPDRSCASKLEYRIKLLTRSDKKRLIVNDPTFSFDLSGCERTSLPVLPSQ